MGLKILAGRFIIHVNTDVVAMAFQTLALAMCYIVECTL